jgi:hypothetical protein
MFKVTARILMLLVVSLPATRSAHAQRKVTLSGIVYAFPSPKPVPGAIVSIAEHPELTTTSDATGRYSLSVPKDAWITPFAVVPGYRTTHLQTFRTDRNIEKVYFEMTPQNSYDAAAVLLGFDPASCQVGSAVTVNAIQNLTFEEYAAYGAYGRAGATISSSPALPGPIYTNEQVLPDPSLTQTTNDGSATFKNVPPGVYLLRAHHPNHRFATARVTCTAGRFIFAGPPWGLWEKS